MSALIRVFVFGVFALAAAPAQAHGQAYGLPPLHDHIGAGAFLLAGMIAAALLVLRWRRARVPVALALAGMFVLAVAPAQAHHVMDSQLPVTAAGGLLSGIGHPVIGLDHFIFIIAMGLACLMTRHRLLLPLVFVGFMGVGVGVHLLAVTIPFAELLIALSVVAVGAWLAVPVLGLAGGAALLAVAGLLHGYAYGEAIVGAETGVLTAYLAGLALVQWAVAVGAQEVCRRLFAASATAAETSPPWRRAGGLVTVAAGVVFFIQNLA